MLINAQALVDRLTFVSQGQQRKGAHPECHQSIIVEVESDETGMGNNIVLRSFSGITHFKAVLGHADDKTIIGSPKLKNEVTKEGDTEVGGPFVFDPRRLMNVLKKSKSSCKIIIDFDKKIIVFQIEGTKIREVGMMANGFAQFPDRDPATVLRVPETLAMALRRSAWAVNKNQHNVAMQGVMIRPVETEDKDYIQICGTDAMILAVVEDHDNPGCVTEPGIIPVESALVLAEVLKRAQAPKFYMDKTRAMAIAGDFEVSALLLGEEMVKFWMFLENIKLSTFRTARMDRERLMDSLNIAATFQDDYGSVLFMFSGPKLKIVGFDQSTGRKAESLVDIERIGSSLDGANFCMSSKSMAGILKNIECDRIDLNFPEGSSASVLAVPVESSSSRTEVFLSLMVMQPHFENIIGGTPAVVAVEAVP